MKKYMLINWWFAAILGLLFMYAASFHLQGAYHVQCYYTLKYHRSCPTCGLSRGFAAIIRGHFKQAEEFNQNAMPVFCFFSLQFFIRLLINLIIRAVASSGKLSLFIVGDVVITAILFFISFHQLIQFASN